MMYSRGLPSAALMVLVRLMPTLAAYQAFWASMSMQFRPAPSTCDGFRLAGGPSAQAALGPAPSPTPSATAAASAIILCAVIRLPPFPALAIQPLVSLRHDMLVDR